MSEKAPDRRRYFRVMDKVGLKVNGVVDGDLSGDIEDLKLSPEDRLAKVNTAINKLLVSVKRQNPELATLMGLLNHKMDLISRPLSLGEDIEDEDSFSSQDVNISACGIAFPYHMDLPIQQLVKLAIKLHPSLEEVNVVASVIAVERRDAFVADSTPAEQERLSKRPFWIRANFEEIAPTEQELLAQHVIQKQTEALYRNRKSG